MLTEIAIFAVSLFTGSIFGYCLGYRVCDRRDDTAIYLAQSYKREADEMMERMIALENKLQDGG